ncbi:MULTISPECIES: hypothetical protein [unclassified Thermosipho (in: thermotogales)]|uniref:hypothetical protein n=1 Tax=unclassified Thermosipho (in: thermotogales) TaxID=2676525 RepID=UPI00098761E6|nr:MULTISPECIES: hypothetical protein [unclassified Thermosipho (in: thermotogales)]MBT1247113.1 hypothetical protein [Thermosipho sp. 1244]OOC46836.1 hypothetical protein XO09_04420 [Thermosipho sp. 1223]
MKKFFLYFFSFLTLIPFVAPIIFSFVAFFSVGHFLYDYLMPVELVIFTLIGGIGTMFFAFNHQRKMIIIFIGIELLTILFAQLYSKFTGLSQGSTSFTGVHVFVISICIVLWHIFSILVSIESFKVVMGGRKIDSVK